MQNSSKVDVDGLEDGFEAMRARLVSDGYRDITDHPYVTVGARVRHCGHQWPNALHNGTGTVLAVMCKDDSTWARGWGRPDVELLVRYDDDGKTGTRTLDGRVHCLADYHVEVIATAGGAA